MQFPLYSKHKHIHIFPFKKDNKKQAASDGKQNLNKNTKKKKTNRQGTINHKKQKNLPCHHNTTTKPLIFCLKQKP